jgi:hypothetical protein
MKSKPSWTIKEEDEDGNTLLNGGDTLSPMLHGNWNIHFPMTETHWHNTNIGITFDTSYIILPSVLKSGSVRFFSLLGSNQNRNRFYFIHRVQKTGSNRTQPVVCGSTWSDYQFWPTQPRPVVVWLESVATDFHIINTTLYMYNKMSNTLYIYIYI